MNIKIFTYLSSLILFSILACKKDKVEMPCPEPETTKWELIEGNYKVYDTAGIFIYDMSINHKYNNQDNLDSLCFNNFDNEFSLSSVQSNFSNFPMYTAIGSHDTLFDSSGNRWKLSAGVDEDYNQLINDTIRLWFQKTNINYYFLDLVPFYACDCKQIAVKQH